MTIYNNSLNSKKKKLALLIDPDKFECSSIATIIKKAHIDLIFVGGSLLTKNNFDSCIQKIKDNCSLPVILFPGNTLQINDKADAILFLSLLSGRNPEMLIGRHVIAAPYLKASKLEVISTGYMLVDSGKPTAALYMSNSVPIPHDKDDIAICTAIAGEMLGMKCIYMDGGSGAEKTISASMITSVKKNISVPLIIGGGIRTPENAKTALDAGADIIVVGNAAETNPGVLEEIGKVVVSGE